MKYLKTAIWFISRPKYLPQIFQIFKRNRYLKKENTSHEATKWAKANAIDKLTTIKEIYGNDAQLIHFKSEFPTIYDYALNQQKNCPVNMGGEGAVDILYSITKYKQPKNIIETGVAYGWSSLAILLGIKDIENAYLISNDMPYIKMNNDDYVGCVVPGNLKSRWELQRLPDVVGIPKALKKFDYRIDLCHYDSDKSYTGRMFAYPLLWDALVPGGIFISDDIQDNIAFKEFSEKIHIRPIIIEHQGKYVGILQKT
jgi:hypothetical protein